MDEIDTNDQQINKEDQIYQDSRLMKSVNAIKKHILYGHEFTHDPRRFIRKMSCSFCTHRIRYFFGNDIWICIH